MNQPPDNTARRSVVDAFKRFIATESSGAKLLLAASVVAAAWVNTPLSSSYDALWTWSLPEVLNIGGRLPDLRHLINDGLMTLFFLVVGLEIKRELVAGELRSLRSALLPIAAAAGGMIVPAIIYAAFNAGTTAGSGWGIPIATDIAFAVAILVALGTRAPTGLKVFLLGLAIVDDIGAIVTIAVFYSQGVQIAWLLILAALSLLMLLLTRSRVLSWLLIIPLGLMLWLSAVFSGVHPTIAGVLLAVALSARDGEGPSVEERLHPWTGLVVVPLFGLANTGVVVNLSVFEEAMTSSVGLGIVLGLVVGKTVGISLFSWLAVKAGIAALPRAVTWRHMIGASVVAGIGFTISIFITDLAFSDPALVEKAKLAVFMASLLAATTGYLILRAQPRAGS